MHSTQLLLELTNGQLSHCIAGCEQFTRWIVGTISGVCVAGHVGSHGSEKCLYLLVNADENHAGLCCVLCVMCRLLYDKVH